MSDQKPHEATVHEAQALPVMLPARLVGRESALAQVYAQLKGGQPVLVHGAPGVGKTALVARLAAAYTQQPGGVLWMNVDNPRLEELLVRVGRAYGVEEIVNTATPLGMVGAVEATLKGGKPLIVLDGAIQPDVASRFISRCAGGLPLVIACEQPLDGAWATFELEPLTTEHATALFRQEALLKSDEHNPDVRRIVELLDNLPYGVIVAARALVAAKQTPGDYLQTLQQTISAVDGDGAIAALTTSFRPLTGALQGLLLMMGATFNGSASVELLSIISGAAPDAVQQALNLLTQLHLLERTQRYGEAYYHMHPITHRFVQASLQRTNRLEALQAKVREAVLGYAAKYSQDSAQAHDKLATEIETFLATARWAASKGERQVAAQITSYLDQAGDFVSERGYLYELQQVRAYGMVSTAFPAYQSDEVDRYAPGADLDDDDFEDEFAEDEFDDMADDSDEVDRLDDMRADIADDDDDDFEDEAEPFDDLDTLDAEDDDDEAIFIAPSVFAEADDDDDEDSAEIETQTAPAPADLLLDDDDEFTGADDDDADDESPQDFLFRMAQEAQDIDEGVVNDEVVTDPDAIDLSSADLNALRVALGKARQADVPAREVEILKAIGQQQIDQGMENEALGTYGELLTAYENQDNRRGILETLDMLSALMARTFNYQAALMHAARGINIAEEMGEDETRMQLLLTLGDARQQLGESETAAADYSRALAISRSRDDEQHEAVILYKLGYAQLDSNDTEAAVDTWEHALTLFKRQARRRYEGRVLGALGSAYGDLGRWAESVNFHTSALYIARETQDRDEESLQLVSMAYAATQANQLGEAVLRYRQALHLAYQTDQTENIVALVTDLARLLLQSRRHVTVAELLVEDALTVEPGDRELLQLRERIASEYQLAESYGTRLIEVAGTAQDYAANAYSLLED